MERIVNLYFLTFHIMKKLISVSVLLLSIFLAGCSVDGEDLEGRTRRFFRSVAPVESVPSCSEWSSAHDKCENLGGETHVGLSELYGEDRVSCHFGDSMRCTQTELNSGNCFMALNEVWHEAYLECEKFGGKSYTALSDLYGEDQLFCSFSGIGGCTQNELVDGECFMANDVELKAAYLKCEELGGFSYTALSELYGEDRAYCSFGGIGECTQNELINGECFMDGVFSF